MKQFLVLLFILLPLSFLKGQVTINVPGDYSTIQAAINAANTGDLVLVAEGTYVENLNFKGKAITVASHFINDPDTSHITQTIIDGSLPSHPDTGSVVLFISGEDTNSVLCGFTITGGSGTYFSPENYRIGGGIMLFYSGAKICHNIITLNTIDNTTTYTRCYGGGILAAHSPNLIIANNVISENLIENYSAVGSGISIYYTGPTWITSNEIIGNVLNCNTGSGGGIDIWSPVSELYASNNIIRGNKALTNNYGGGGIDIWDSSAPIVVSNNLIAENVGYLGGGILVDKPTTGDFSKTNGLILNNYSSDINNGVNNSSYPTDKLLVEAVLENNTIVDNYATSYCGGIYCRNTSPEIRNSIIWGNTAPAGPQIEGAGLVEYSDVEGSYPGTGNINDHPLFDMTSEYYLLTNPSSPCIDAGDPDPIYNDVENPLISGTPMPPAYGTLRNDMGHCGGPNSCWCFWPWPVPVELTSFTASVQFGKVNLHWTTATETNNLGFEIERKLENAVWERVGFAEGHGTTSEPQAYSFIDDISSIYASTISYRLKQLDFDGSYEYSYEVFADNLAPINYSLEQNYPNPFNPSTIISYSLPIKSQVELVVYNELGEEIFQLLNAIKEAGFYEIEFSGTALPSGVYFYRLQAGDFVQVRKMILLK